MTLRYRPEIDGLRAVAVLAVVAYHAGLTPSQQPLPGGFLGVDIFFVISGYLIASIILRGIADGTFTFAGFYERRARRILPALLVVIAATIPFALSYMTPEQLEEYGGSAFSALLFFSNFWFFQENSYNAEISSLKPLLHTWSLALEEQFYLIAPILLLIVARYASSRMSVVLTTLLLLSFGCALFSNEKYPDAAFYLLPARGWELLAGALIAQLELVGWREWRWPLLDVTMPVIGLGLIGYSFIAFDDTMLHPSFATAVTVVGAVLILWFGRPGELVTNLLASTPFVAVGLISYSLYLWHFPIFSFADLRALSPLTYSDRLGQFALAVGLSVLSYFLIEQPARKAAVVPIRRFVPIVAAASILLIASAAAAVLAQGFPARFGKVSDMVAAAIRNDHETFRQDGQRCTNGFVDSLCQYFPTTAPDAKTVINLGDSIATRLAPELLAFSKRHGLNYVDLTFGGCPYILGTTTTRVRDRQACRELLAATRKYLSNTSPSIVVISGRYQRYLSGSGYDNREGGVEPTRNIDVVPDAESVAAGLRLAELIQRSIEDLVAMGHTVVLVYPIPEAGWHIPRHVLRLSALKGSDRLDVSTSLAAYRERTKETKSIFDAVGSAPNLLRVFPETVFCSEATQRCQTHDRDDLYYSDTNHLSPRGAHLLVQKIETAIVDRVCPNQGRDQSGSVVEQGHDVGPKLIGGAACRSPYASQSSETRLE